jgi:hypothetical protein
MAGPQRYVTRDNPKAWSGMAKRALNSSRSASRPTCRISRAGAPASSERRIPTRDVRCSDVPTLNFPTPHFHNRVVPGLRCRRMAHHMTGSQKVFDAGGQREQVPPVYGVKQGWPASGTNRQPFHGQRVAPGSVGSSLSTHHGHAGHAGPMSSAGRDKA